MLSLPLYIGAPIFWRTSCCCLLPLPAFFSQAVAWCHHRFALLLLFRFFPSCHLIPSFSAFLFQSLSVIILFRLSIICMMYVSSPTNLAACRHPLQVNPQAPLLISVQELVQPELSNCIQLLQRAHTKCLLGGGLFFGGILRSTDSIDGIALKKAVFPHLVFPLGKCPTLNPLFPYSLI